jgi:hypothetical protein
MTTCRILSVVGLLALAGPVYADTMPFFGANPSDGSYWNGSGHKYRPAGSAFDAMARGTRPDHRFTLEACAVAIALTAFRHRRLDPCPA